MSYTVDNQRQSHAAQVGIGIKEDRRHLEG